ncbi:MAG: hypothetical protein EB165_04635 [Euryarchaeota archaeon]|nr:hypothetical protein [Euryarchaeota archaeon]
MIDFKTLAMSATITGKDEWRANVLNAWHTSRSPGEDTPEELIQIDAPISEVCGGGIIRFTVPILFREILATYRDHQMWARTSRVDDLTKVWPITYYMSDEDIKSIRELALGMERDLRSGMNQDSYRYSLPLGYMTTLTCRFSIRSLIRIVQDFRLIASEYPRIHDPAAVFAELVRHELNGIGVPNEIINSYKPTKVWRRMGPERHKVAMRIADYIMIRRPMKIALRAQLVRHRSLSIRDSLPNLCDQENGAGILTRPISTPIDVEVMAHLDTWTDLISKRNCWVAQRDLWADLVDDVNKYTSSGRSMELPCKEGHCPFEADAMARIRREDPNPPCPRHINLSARAKEAIPNYWSERRELNSIMLDYMARTGKPAEFWRHEVLRLNAD